MPNTVDGSGRALANFSVKKIAAGQTTINLSTPLAAGRDGPKDRDYVSHLIITAASTAAPGAVTLFDGTTSMLVHSFVSDEGMGETVQTVVVDMIAKSSVGFNITTGTSVSVVAVGRWDNG